jgi:hypothetical protein
VLINLAHWHVVGDAANLNVMLTATVLFAHFELLMGNFRQFGSHSMGANTLLSFMETASTYPTTGLASSSQIGPKPKHTTGGFAFTSVLLIFTSVASRRLVLRGS